MDIGQAIWIFFLLTALQPVVKQRLLESSRMRLLAQIERRRESRVILLVHRQETMSLLGFPLMRYIDVNDAENVMRACEMTDPEMPLDLVLHTPGGLVLASLQIARAVRNHKGKVTVFVPHYAMSGGPLIASAAAEIVMSPHAVRAGRSSARAVLGRLAAQGRGEEADRRDRGSDAHSGRRGREGHQPGPGQREGPPHAKPAAGEGRGAGRPALHRDLDPRLSHHVRGGAAAGAQGPFGHAPGCAAAHESVPATRAAATVGGISAGPAPGGAVQAAGLVAGAGHPSASRRA